MKTPRELLLARHAEAQARLDVLRREIVAEHVGAPIEFEAPASADGLIQVWHEVFWASRRSWLAVGAAWLAILALNLACHYPSSQIPPSARAKPSAPNLRLALSEQVRLRAELLQNQEPPATQSSGRPIAPGPRSDLCPLSSPTTA